MLMQNDAETTPASISPVSSAQPSPIKSPITNGRHELKLAEDHPKLPAPDHTFCANFITKQNLNVPKPNLHIAVRANHIQNWRKMYEFLVRIRDGFFCRFNHPMAIQKTLW